MVTVIVVVMDAVVAMVVTVMDVIVTETVIAIVMVVVVVVEVKVKVAQDLQMDAAKENIIAAHKLNKRECPLRAFSFYFCNCAYYIVVMIEKGLLYACKAWLRCDECAFEECIPISNDDVRTVSENR